MKANCRRVTRRAFLGAAGVAAAPWVIPSSALGLSGQAAPSQRIATALIGSGGRGRQIMEGASQVVAVCDVDARHREDAKEQVEAMSGLRGCRSCGDFREVLDSSDVDAVVIATPDHWHAPISLAAIHAGKAVYVEKPLTLTIREGRVLADAARRYGAILQVGSQQRSDEKFIRACELVRNGRIGQLRTVLVEITARPGRSTAWSPQPVPPELDYEMWLGPAPWAPYHPDRCHYNFRFISDYSGGDITNWGAHHLDIAQWALDADQAGPVAVEGYGQRNATGLHDSFYDVHVDFTYPGGVQLQLRSVPQSPGDGYVRFEGSEGWIMVSRSRLVAEPKSLLTARIGPDEIQLSRGPEGAGGTHMGVWLQCIRLGNAKELNSPAEAGHRSATVCHLANIAMALGGRLEWDPVEERFVGCEEANRQTWRPMRAPWRM